MKKIKLITGLATLATLGTSVTVLASCSKEVVIDIEGGSYDKEKSHVELNKDSTIYLLPKKGKSITGVKKVMVGGVKLTSNQYEIEVDTEEGTCALFIHASAMTSKKVVVEVDYGEPTPVPEITEITSTVFKGDDGITDQASVNELFTPSKLTVKGKIDGLEQKLTIGDQFNVYWGDTDITGQIITETFKFTTTGVNTFTISAVDSLTVYKKLTINVVSSTYTKAQFKAKYTEYWNAYQANNKLFPVSRIKKATSGGSEVEVNEIYNTWTYDIDTKKYQKVLDVPEEVRKSDYGLGGVMTPEMIENDLPQESDKNIYNYDSTTGLITYTAYDEDGKIDCQMQFDKNALMTILIADGDESIIEINEDEQWLEERLAPKLSDTSSSTILINSYEYIVDKNNKIKPIISLRDTKNPTVNSVKLGGKVLVKDNDYTVELISTDETKITFKNVIELKPTDQIEIDATEPAVVGKGVKLTADATTTMTWTADSQKSSSLKYSFTGKDGEWNDAVSGTPITYGDQTDHMTLYLKGTLINKSGDCNIINISATSGNATTTLSGSMMNLLLDGEGKPSTTMPDYAFYALFSGSTGIKSIDETNEKILPMTTLSDRCYTGMFAGCSNLISSPSLPAETLTTECYMNMFRKCESLQKAPDLPAKTLAESCYNSMFEKCKALKTAPSLPAEEMQTLCYNSMFAESGLTTLPELKSEVLAASCYKFMFQDCTKLDDTISISLPATTLAQNCYTSMFNGCTSIKVANFNLPAETLTYDCYAYMFNGCYNLTTPPTIKCTQLAGGSCSNMFAGCSNLKVNNTGASGTLFFTCPNTSGLNNPVKDMFKNTGSYQSDPETDGKYYFDK